MAVSPISLFADEYFVQALASFERSGTMYAVWAALGTQVGSKNVYWRAYTGADFTEVQGDLSAAFSNVSAIWRSSNDTIVVAHDTDGGLFTTSTVFISVFNPTTGALISGPTKIASGFRPRLVYRGGVVGDKMLLVYGNRAKQTVYLRESENGGGTWTAERPIMSNLVANTQGLHAVPFDDEHFSLLTLGQDSRLLGEIGSISHTRPWVALVKHPTNADQWFVAESAQNSGSGLADLLRGSLLNPPGSSEIFWADGSPQGTSDGIGSVALLSTTGNNFSVLNSVSPTPSVAGQDVVALSLTPTSLFVTNVLSSGPVIASMGASAAFIYVAAYSDTPGNDGALVVYRISDQAFSSIASVSNGHAVGVGIPNTGAAVICFGTTESSQEKLRIYTENALSPTFQITHKMPARVNAINVVLTSATQGTLYVSMVDRLNVYALNGLVSPLRLLLSIPILSRGSFFQSTISTHGNIIAAMGKGGVGVFDTEGRTIAQTVLSGLGMEPWIPNTAYSNGNTVVPTPNSFYAPQRTYFKVTNPGTSAQNEPYWAPVGNTVNDGTSLQWQEQTDIQSVVTGVAFDQTRNRIYAVGVVGGTKGVVGRFYALSATGLL